MWRNSILRISRSSNSIIKRNYLSESYKLNQEWEQRLKTPILQKVNGENLYVDLSTKFQQKKKIAAIDVDIYLNKADERNVEEAADLLQKLRLTAQAHKILDSSQHAFVRVSQNNYETLFSVLNSRLDYGVFLDYYTANWLMDKFILEKNYMYAARIATLQMIQEDFNHPITRYLSVYSVYKFLDNIETFVDLIPPVPVEEEAVVVKPVSKKKKDEIKKRVAYLRNPYFDDHFDITSTNHLVGKTLLCLAEEVKKDDEILANSLNLLGYALYEKYEDGIKFVEKSKQSQFYKEALDKLNNVGSKAENLNENGQKFYESAKAISKLKDAKVDEVIEGFLKKAIRENESKDIESQKQTFQSWIEVREQTLNDEINRLKRIQRLEDIEKLQEEMDKQEQKLWFFENIEDVKLDIEKKKVFYPKRWFGKKKKPKKLDENYIPPDVESITRARRAK